MFYQFGALSILLLRYLLIEWGMLLSLGWWYLGRQTAWVVQHKGNQDSTRLCIIHPDHQRSVRLTETALIKSIYHFDYHCQLQLLPEILI